ncbi:hypothetical protein GQ43DRAFT_133033 [Delitschia confertaspora ATCC 74209]|uniref:Cyclin-D1-binding protein 1-like N-terminal domain-containing protein n=1 Tax=Delitschia confertaspora ATCC 74209 TaxID=1513339 RepID=A0A9P4JIU0_9PLEO|nr:hypothetical protein GQ43DRAFT_133033 [Delitschia confertaspora ATCC 74209]
MPPKKSEGTSNGTAASKNDAALHTLIDLTKTTQTLLTHFQSSLTPPASSTVASTQNTTSPTASAPPTDPLPPLKATATLLRSHTTTLSLLLLTPPFSPTAISKKLGDVSSSVLSGMVAAASSPSSSSTTTSGEVGQDSVSALMRSELRAMVRRALSAWGDVLGLVLRLAVGRKGGGAVSEVEKRDVLSATGVVWECCDALIKVCEQGIVGLVVRKAEEWRGVLMDAVGELKEWGEDVDDGDEEDGDEVVGSGDEEEDEFKSEDDIFGAANKLGKGDKELKVLLDGGVKKLKMVGVLYQALIKRRLRTFPATSLSNERGDAKDPMQTLEKLMLILKGIPESVDDLASAFYDLDEEEARKELDKCCDDARKAIELVKQGWNGSDDEFTAWSGKWTDALGSV